MTLFVCKLCYCIKEVGEFWSACYCASSAARRGKRGRSTATRGPVRLLRLDSVQLTKALARAQESEIKCILLKESK